MTLFRKVFQNQSRPATGEEALDEDALRAAFTEMRETDDPLILDPFEHAASYGGEADENTDVADNPHDDGVSQDVDAPQSSELEDDTQADEILAAVTDDVSADMEDTFDDEGAQEESAGDGEAFLEDALVAEVPMPQDMENAEENYSDPVADGPAQDDAASTEEPELDDTQISGDADIPSATDEAEAEQFDIAAFAKQQMASIEPAPQTEVAPAEQSEESAEDTEGTMASETLPDLDLGAVPAPASGRAGRRAGRVKTRLLGFNRAGADDTDPFGQPPESTATAQREKYPVGWLVIVEGPGLGHAFSIFTGASMIGRGEDQVIRLDFGDNSISRNNHAAVAYDEEQNKFYIGHGGKSNIIRRNARPVLSTEELHHADLIRIGETTLRFVALCGSDFQWQYVEHEDAPDA